MTHHTRILANNYVDMIHARSMSESSVTEKEHLVGLWDFFFLRRKFVECMVIFEFFYLFFFFLELSLGRSLLPVSSSILYFQTAVKSCVLQ